MCLQSLFLYVDLDCNRFSGVALSAVFFRRLWAQPLSHSLVSCFANVFFEFRGGIALIVCACACLGARERSERVARAA